MKTDAQDLLQLIRTPAASLAVFDAASVHRASTAGVQREGTARAIGPDASWHLGSCTKAMTATVIGRLVDRSLISFSTSIGEALSGFPVHDGFRDVTVAQLLRHCGGVTGDVEATHPVAMEIMERNANRDPYGVRRQAVSEVLSMAPSHEVGSPVYSNMGYCVAAAMAEELSGKPWERLIRREVFEPLDMASAGFGPPGGESPWPHRHDGAGDIFVPIDPALAEADNPPALGPAGTVHASLPDWIRFLRLFLGGVSEEFLSRDIVTEICTPAEGTGAAAGWYVMDDDGYAKALVHTGTNTMNFCLAVLYVEKGCGIAMTTNGFTESLPRMMYDFGLALLREAAS